MNFKDIIKNIQEKENKNKELLEKNLIETEKRKLKKKELTEQVFIKKSNTFSIKEEKEFKEPQNLKRKSIQERIQFWNDLAEREKEYWAKIIKEINARQNNSTNNTKIYFNKNNENLNIIEKAGELKGLSKEEISKNKEITQLIEDMNAMGTIIKESIKLEKKKYPEKFFSDKEILSKSSDEQLRALSIFSKSLENQGMTTAIQKETEGEDKNTLQTMLQFLVNGISNKTKYNLHFDFGEEKNKKLLKEENERKKFHEKLRKKLSKDFNINEEYIIITFPRKGSYQVTIIFNSNDFKLEKEDLMAKFSNEKDELGKLKDVEKGLIIDGCYLSKNQLDYRGNNRDPGWAGIGEKRGGEEYIPPIGWVGYGLKVLDVYEDNIWLGMNNIKGEWCVAYHGVGDGQPSEKVIKDAGLIYKGGFKSSHRNTQANVEDKRHPGKTCGYGVYCSPDIAYAEDYAGKTEFNGEKYKVVLMLRINPDKIRQSKDFPKEYILNPLKDEIRPYRILLKKV